MIQPQSVRCNLVDDVLNKLQTSVMLQKSNNIYGFLLIVSVQKSEKIKKNMVLLTVKSKSPNQIQIDR